MQSKPTIRRNFQTCYQRTGLARSTILRWIECVNIKEMSKIKLVEESFQFPGQPYKTVKLYFHHSPTRSLWKAVADAGMPYYTIPNILKRLLHMIPNKITIVKQLQQCYAQRAAFTQLRVDTMTSDF